MQNTELFNYIKLRTLSSLYFGHKKEIILSKKQYDSQIDRRIVNIDNALNPLSVLFYFWGA